MRLREYMFPKTDWLIDCTDELKSQEENQAIAEKHGARYMKVGYDGEAFSINNKVASWGEAEDGYVVVPDGSGAIVSLEADPEVKASFTLDVYGSDLGYMSQAFRTRDLTIKPIGL